MPDTVKLKEGVTLRHQSNLGEEIEEIAWEPGSEFTVLKEWASAYLVKDSDGRLFNLKKALTERG